MLSNKEVVNAFLNHKKAKNTNMKSTGYRLYSWNTCIAEHYNEKLIVNLTKYSRSTSKQQNYLPQGDYCLTDIPYNAAGLIGYINRKTI